MEEKELEINRKIAAMVLIALNGAQSEKLKKLAALLNKRAEFEEVLSEINPTK